MHGRCLCGDVRITVDGDYIAAIGACHCIMCQRNNGVVFAAFEASADAVSATGPVRTYASSEFAERTFCGTCGSPLWLRDTKGTYASAYELMPGLFADAAAFPLISEIYHDRAPAYVTLAGDHRRMTRADYEQKNLHIEGDMR
nr:GFA family protein [Octadecabacter dasysiphoniae]